MLVEQINENIYVSGLEYFSLEQTLECGQCFHFKKIAENEYGISAYRKMLHIKQEKDRLILFNTEMREFNDIWKYYFDLDRDYGKIRNQLLESDDKLKDSVEAMWGIHILNQEFFETLISFIISQNKQIKHIKHIVEAISEKYGNYLGNINDIDFYSFPDAETLRTVTKEQLLELKTGFRAPYIRNAVDMVLDGCFEEKKLRDMSAQQCIEELIRIKGVGNKVANCVSLFSLGHRESFPVDVWIKRVMEDLYFDGKTTSIQDIQKIAEMKYGKYGGYAQQYLFHYGRTKALNLKKL